MYTSSLFPFSFPLSLLLLSFLPSPHPKDLLSRYNLAPLPLTLPSHDEDDAPPLLFSTASLNFAITSAGSFAPNTAEPATITFAPASAATSIVFSDSPPSTSIFRSGYFARRADTLGMHSGMNFCPPKPGSTVIIRTICCEQLVLARGLLFFYGWGMVW